MDEPLTHDPERAFGEPRKLLEDPSLTRERKLEILESWRRDLIELQVAEGENMPGSSAESGATTDKLVEVTKAIEAIKEPKKGSDPFHQKKRV